MIATILDMLVGEWLPYIIAGAAAVISFFLYGRNQKKAGRREAQIERSLADHAAAAEVRRRLNENRNDRGDRDPVDRLREAGRLREGD